MQKAKSVPLAVEEEPLEFPEPKLSTWVHLSLIGKVATSIILYHSAFPQHDGLVFVLLGEIS